MPDKSHETPPLKTQAGALLKAERLAQGLTQDQFAERVGVARRTVQRWEGTDSTVDLAELEVALRALGVAVDLVPREARSIRGDRHE